MISRIRPPWSRESLGCGTSAVPTTSTLRASARCGPVPRRCAAGLHQPVAVRVRDEHTVNEAGMDVSRVRREHPDEIKLILGAIDHQHMAVRAPAESRRVSAGGALPLAGLV